MNYPVGTTDRHGNVVNGATDLMGLGMGLRPFYFNKWKEALNSKHNKCNYSIRFRGVLPNDFM